jgi:hypothetical protein
LQRFCKEVSKHVTDGRAVFDLHFLAISNMISDKKY